MKLTIATSQFPISGRLTTNLRHISDHMKRAAGAGADVVHFPEAALPGYLGVDLPSLADYDWQALGDAHQAVCTLAKALKLWTILGSMHRLSGRHKPHNCLYIIDDRGRLIDRYDKMFCTGGPACDSGDLANYSPGHHLPVFRIRGVTCGTQICHDFRYQEIYRAYKARGVQLVFHSYHNARVAPREFLRTCRVLPRNRSLNIGVNIHGTLVPATMQAYAANNAMWISVTNSAAKQSSWPGFFVRPDGIITGRLVRNHTGLLISHLDTGTKYYDASAHWRRRAMEGVLHSGTLVKDSRSDDRRSF